VYPPSPKLLAVVQADGAVPSVGVRESSSRSPFIFRSVAVVARNCSRSACPSAFADSSFPHRSLRAATNAAVGPSRLRGSLEAMRWALAVTYARRGSAAASGARRWPAFSRIRLEACPRAGRFRAHHSKSP
jgi:hypothetical protein